jgi:hypothetical protein
MAQSLAQRFWSKVEKRGPNECWPWLGTTLKDGRGQISVDRKGIPAPRVALQLAGFDLNGLIACHKNECHNPNCVNPAHLYAGTYSQNTMDSIAIGTHKGGAPKGEGNYNSKLKEADIPEIRRLSTSGMSRQEIGDVFSVSRAAIWKILKGEMWSHVR